MNTVVEKANRILTIIPLVRSNPGITIADLARRLGVTPRTIASDLNTLLMCGVPPYLPNDYVGVYIEKGRVRLEFADHFKRPVTFTATEALALKLALQNMPAVAGTHAAELKEKLEGIMPGELSEKFDRRFRVTTGSPALRKRIEKLQRAVDEMLEVGIEYYTAARDAMSERTVRPYAIIEHQGQWYLVAWCMMRGKEVRFRIDRIKSVELTDHKFERPADFDIDKYRRPDMFVSPENQPLAEIRMSPQLARWLAPRGGNPRLDGAPSVLEYRRQPDGSIIVKIPAAGAEWLASWAAQHGDSLEILSPPEQRARMKKFCEDLLRIYE